MWFWSNSSGSTRFCLLLNAIITLAALHRHCNSLQRSTTSHVRERECRRSASTWCPSICDRRVQLWGSSYRYLYPHLMFWKLFWTMMELNKVLRTTTRCMRFYLRDGLPSSSTSEMVSCTEFVRLGRITWEWIPVSILRQSGLHWTEHCILGPYFDGLICIQDLRVKLQYVAFDESTQICLIMIEGAIIRQGMSALCFKPDTSLLELLQMTKTGFYSTQSWRMYTARRWRK